MPSLIEINHPESVKCYQYKNTPKCLCMTCDKIYHCPHTPNPHETIICRFAIFEENNDISPCSREHCNLYKPTDRSWNELPNRT